MYDDMPAALLIGWHEGTDDPVSVHQNCCSILAAYRDPEDRFSLAETKRSALDMVKFAAQNKTGHFTRKDIREL